MPRSPSGASARPSPRVLIKSLERNALHTSRIRDMVRLNGNRSKSPARPRRLRRPVEIARRIGGSAVDGSGDDRTVPGRRSKLAATALEAKLFTNAGTKRGHRCQVEPNWTTINREPKRKHVTRSICGTSTYSSTRSHTATYAHAL
jgi:hypothetical protein